MSRTRQELQFGIEGRAQRVEEWITHIDVAAAAAADAAAGDVKKKKKKRKGGKAKGEISL